MKRRICIIVLTLAIVFTITTILKIKAILKNEADKLCACLLLACYGFAIIFTSRKMAKTDHCAFQFGSTVRPRSRA